MDKLNKTEKVVAALLLGAVIGLVLGLIFAPDSGKNTASKAESFNDTIKRKWNFLINEAKKNASKNKENETPEA